MTLVPEPSTQSLTSALRSLSLVKGYGTSSARISAGKALFDKLFALTALVLLLPLLVLIALAILVVDRQGFLFSQARVGENGRLFRCWKFRTMAKDADKRLAALLASDPAIRAEWEENFKLQNDPRINRIGRFLRKTSLDELPQFWNVLMGQMSMVGPRPIVSEEIARYGDRYWAYASTRPGLTGIWQVQGRSDTTYEQRVSMDVDYALSHSLWGDLGIILRTVYVVVFRVGAY